MLLQASSARCSGSHEWAPSASEEVLRDLGRSTTSVCVCVWWVGEWTVIIKPETARAGSVALRSGAPVDQNPAVHLLGVGVREDLLPS